MASSNNLSILNYFHYYFFLSCFCFNIFSHPHICLYYIITIIALHPHKFITFNSVSPVITQNAQSLIMALRSLIVSLSSTLSLFFWPVAKRKSKKRKGKVLNKRWWKTEGIWWITREFSFLNIATLSWEIYIQFSILLS